MSLPEIVDRDTWLSARTSLLARELRRQQDALNADRRRLPMVRIEKDYRFLGPDGEVGLADLFGGRRQLLLQHVMFDPSWDDACSSCTAGVDELAEGLIRHLHARDTEYVLVSRTPLDKIEAYRKRRGWTLPWYSSLGSDFNYDFHVTMDERVTPAVYNYRTSEEYAARGWPDGLVKPGESSEQPGLSSFLREGDDVFHTYSAFARGVDFGGAYSLLDITALGRQEEWEEPKGRSVAPGEASPDFA